MIPANLANAKERYESEQQLAALQREVRTRYGVGDFGGADGAAAAAADPELATAAARAAEDASTTFGGVVIHSSREDEAANASSAAAVAATQREAKLPLTEVAKAAGAMARRVLGADHPVVASCLSPLAARSCYLPGTVCSLSQTGKLASPPGHAQACAAEHEPRTLSRAGEIIKVFWWRARL